jgi:sugar fermentation stimulation protein A
VSQGKISELAGYAELRRELQRTRTRIDLVVRGNGLRPCYMKVESVTFGADGTALFPDTQYDNGPEVMNELTNLVREGNRVMFMFLAQRADVERFKLADHIDPEFCQVFRDAVARGVETTCYRAKVTRRGIEIDDKLALELGEP